MFSFYWLGLKKIFNFGKKILLVFFVYLAIISLFLYFINKDKPKTTYDPIKKNREEIYKVINDPQFNKTSEGKIIIASYRMMLCGMIGEACTDNPDDGDKNFNHSLFGFMANLLVLPYANPPASGVYWAYSGLQNAGFVPKTYAAEGVGFGSIKALNKIWLVMRNFSFMVIVLVIVAIGFMIMFRAKLNPQTVISIENALPKIVITLLLINFSFAIAGFLIDLMYLSLAIIISLLAQAGGLDTASTIGKYLTANPGSLIGGLFGGDNFLSKIFNLGKMPIDLVELFGWTGRIFVMILSIFLTIFFIGPFVVNNLIPKNLMKDLPPEINAEPAGVGASWKILGVIFGWGTTILGFFIALILTPVALLLILILLIFLSIIFLAFRIFFTLLTSYIKIILLIIFSPLMILMNALPGQSPFNFESWLKNLLGELLTLVLVVAIFMVGNVIATTLSSSTTYLTPPFLIGLNANSLVFLLGMGILFMTPDLVKTFKQLILPKPVPFPEVGPGIFFGGVPAALGGALGEAGKWGSTMYHVRYVAPILEKFGIKLPEKLFPKG